ncbi:MAG: hypothetical protein ACKVHL_12450, partial [Rhodospirillales bacterium]
MQEIREELAKQPDTEETDPDDLNDIIDATGKPNAKQSAVRMHRKRSRTALLNASIIEEVLDDEGLT